MSTEADITWFRPRGRQKALARALNVQKALAHTLDLRHNAHTASLYTPEAAAARSVSHKQASAAARKPRQRPEDRADHLATLNAATAAARAKKRLALFPEISLEKAREAIAQIDAVRPLMDAIKKQRSATKPAANGTKEKARRLRQIRARQIREVFHLVCGRLIPLVAFHAAADGIAAKQEIAFDDALFGDPAALPRLLQLAAAESGRAA
jgi:hypothetical protein